MSSKQKNLINGLEHMKSMLAVYDQKTKEFYYHPDLLENFGGELSGFALWDFLVKKNIISEEDAENIKNIAVSLDEKHSVYFKVYSFGVKGRYILSFSYSKASVTILLKLFDQGDFDEKTIKYDSLTKLIRRECFCDEIAKLNQKNADKQYALCYFDIIKFKAINDIFGFEEGDALLKYIADTTRSGILVTPK